jgi:hypothetical protein
MGGYMKNLKFLIIVCIGLFSLKDVYSLAISQPLPTNITVKRGESLPFRFEIQAINSNDDFLCTYSINGLNSLKISFNDEITVVKARNITQIHGILEIPDISPIKEYNGNLAVSCSPVNGNTGSAITQNIGFSFKVNVVTGENKNNHYMEIIPVITGIVIILFLLGTKFVKRFNKARKRRKRKII